jgi:hypothetical protein
MWNLSLSSHRKRITSWSRYWNPILHHIMKCTLVILDLFWFIRKQIFCTCTELRSSGKVYWWSFLVETTMQNWVLLHFKLQFFWIKSQWISILILSTANFPLHQHTLFEREHLLIESCAANHARKNDTDQHFPTVSQTFSASSSHFLRATPTNIWRSMYYIQYFHF